MRWLYYRRGILGTVLLFCTVFLQAKVDIQEQSSYQITYDQFGNPCKLLIDSTRIITPVFDGVLLHDQQEMYSSQQEFLIHDFIIQENKNEQKFSAQLPKYKSKYTNESNRFLQPQNRTFQSGFFARATIVLHQCGYFESMSDNEFWAYCLYDRYCKLLYHMDICAKIEMMNLSCDTFKKKLLQNPKLSERAVLELLHDYLSNCNQSKQKFIDLKTDVTEAVNQRVQQKSNANKKILQQKIDDQKAIAQQEIQSNCIVQQKQFLKQQHTEVESLHWINMHLTEDVIEQRTLALEQAHDEDYKQYDQQYELDTLACGYLISNNIDYLPYKQCYGTALQQQYHQEICDIFTQAAHQQFNITKYLHHNNQSLFLEHASNFAQGAYETNIKNLISVTATLCTIGSTCIDICKDMYDRPIAYGKAVAEGIVESAVDLSKIFLHPFQTMYGLGQMIYFVIETVAIADINVHFPNCCKLAWQKRRDQILGAVEKMQQDFSKMDGPERLKVITKFGADFYLTPKLTHAVGYLLSGTGSAIKSALINRCITTEEVAQAAQEIELVTEHGVIQQAVTEFTEAEKIATAAHFVPRSLPILIEEICTTFNGVIPFHCTALYKEFNLALKLFEKQLHIAELAKFQKILGQKNIAGKLVRLALNHMCSVELSLIESAEHGGYIIKFGGGHLPSTCESLAKSGLIKILSKKRLASGAVHYQLRSILKGKPFFKTEFPSGWTAEKLAKAAWEVYENESLLKDFTQDGKFCKTGFFENVELKVIWSQKGKGKQIIDYINTAMPIKI